MKRVYSEPSAEKVNFSYKEQVVAQSGAACHPIYCNIDTNGDFICDSGNPHQGGYSNVV